MPIRTNYRHTQYACYLGYITQAIVNNLAPLLFVIFQQAFAISLEKITLLVTGNFCLQLLVDLIAARFVDKIGYRPCVVAAHLFAAAGLIGMGTFPRLFPDPYAGLMLAVGLYAIGGGLIEVLISPIVEACPTENKASVMSLLHSFYCWGTVGVILLSPLFLQAAGLGKLFSMKLFWVFALLRVAAGACEQAMSQWASAFAESGLGVSKAVGDLAGPCMFSVLMGLSRVAYAKWGDRLSLLNCEIACGLCCAGGYLLAALAPHPALALVGCGICGVSVGILWPGTFSVASRHCPKGGTAMFALLALAGDLGCTSGPTLVGMASGLLGGQLKAGLLLAVVFPALLIGAALACKRLLARGESPARKG